MIPLRFGSIDREMLGMLSSAGPANGDLAMLFCNPFGQEAVRTQTMYRSFADRLLRQGVHVLRFDYHGTGDSPGEGDDQTLKDWVRDTRMACEAFLGVTHAKRLQLFGLGLGATIAACAALDLDPVPERLALWQPVTDGVAYLERLQAAHRQDLAVSFSEPWPRVRRLLRTAEPHAPGFVLGFPVGQRLTEELAALRGLPLQALANRGCRIDGAAAPHLIAQEPSHALIRWRTPEQDVSWMSNEAVGAAIVSSEIWSFLFKGLDAK